MDNLNNNKDIDAQNRRLKSFEERERLVKKRRKCIARSLRSDKACIDNKRRKVFNSDDEIETNTKKNIIKLNNDDRFIIDENFESNSSESESEKSNKNVVENTATTDKILLPNATDNAKQEVLQKTFYEVDKKFFEELKTNKTKNSTNTFSFLSSIGREKPVIPNLTNNISNNNKKKDDENLILPSIEKRTNLTSNSITFLQNILESGILTEDDKNHPILLFDFKRIQSSASSFCQHNIKHIKQNWMKPREAFVKFYKKQRKLTLKKFEKNEYLIHDSKKLNRNSKNINKKKNQS